ncbi:hypothetical protein FRX31_022506, partial [Thalictrum thalictroides]
MEQINVEISENSPIQINFDEIETGHEEESTKTVGSENPKKRTRRTTSKVWNHYTPIGKDKDGHNIAKCNKCGHNARCD